MQCAQELKTRCPDTHTALEAVLSDLKSAAELCVYPDLIDGEFMSASGVA